MGDPWAPDENNKVPVSGYRIEQLRGILGGISQKELAERCGISQREISRWENGGKASVALYERLLSFFRIADNRQLDSRFEIDFRPLVHQVHGGRIAAKNLPLAIPFSQWDPTWMPPAALLRADLGVVRFHMRDQELDELLKWCNRDEPILTELCHGAGGMGKTRLAIELCSRIDKQSGWSAGFLDYQQFQADRDQWRTAFEAGESLLVILDYAEHRSDIIHWLFEMAVEVPGARVRFLLLARKPGEWLDRLTSRPTARDVLSGPGFRKRMLEPIAVLPHQRLESWQIANEDLANALNVAPAASPTDALDQDCFQRILLLQMSALAALENESVSGENGILDYVLRREQSFWSSQLRKNGLPESFTTGVGQALAAITLNMGATDESDGLKVLETLPFFEGQPHQVLHTINRILADSYPGGHWIEPVQPDLLGERLCEISLYDDELRDTLFGIFLEGN